MNEVLIVPARSPHQQDAPEQEAGSNLREDCDLRCRICLRNLPESNFYVGSNGKPMSSCKKCFNKRNADRKRSGRNARQEKHKPPHASSVVDQPGAIDVVNDNPTPIAAASWSRVLFLNLEDRPDLYDRLAQQAQTEERTIEGHVRYLLRQVLSMPHYIYQPPPEGR